MRCSQVKFGRTDVRKLDLGSLVDGAEHLVHLGAESAEFPSVKPRELLEVGSAFGGGRDEDSSCVVGIGPAFDEAMLDCATYKFACRVQADVQLLGDVGE